MPNETVETGGVEEPFDSKLNNKSDSGKNYQSRKIHPVNIELATHNMFYQVTLTVAAASGEAGANCAGRYGAAFG